MNNVFVVGHVTGELKTTVFNKADGTTGSVHHFGIASNDGFGERQTTAFFNCTAFGNLSNVTKGTKLIIQGHMVTETYEKDGQKNTSQSLMVDHWEFAIPKNSGNANAAVPGFNVTPQVAQPAMSAPQVPQMPPVQQVPQSAMPVSQVPQTAVPMTQVPQMQPIQTQVPQVQQVIAAPAPAPAMEIPPEALAYMQQQQQMPFN